MTPRERRLRADHGALRQVSSEHVTIEPLGAEPADSYRVTYHLRGVTLGLDGQPAISDHQQVVLTLGPTYPRDRPALLAETAIFHPNVPPAIGHHFSHYERWSAAEPLWSVVAKVARLIQFQDYDLEQVQNPIAAAWVAANPTSFPVGQVQLPAAAAGPGEAEPDR
jgi:ubiquitin-protein ligase